MCKNPVITTRSKHIALDFHFVREYIGTGALQISQVSSVDQPADIFTKALGKDRITQLCFKLQVRHALELAGGDNGYMYSYSVQYTNTFITILCLSLPLPVNWFTITTIA